MGGVNQNIKLYREMPFLAFTDSDAMATAAHALVSCEEMNSEEREVALKKLLNDKAWIEYNKWKTAKIEGEMDFLRLISPSMRTLVKQKLEAGDMDTAATLISTTTPAAVTAFSVWRSSAGTRSFAPSAVKPKNTIAPKPVHQTYKVNLSRGVRRGGSRNTPVATVRPLRHRNSSDAETSKSSTSTNSSSTGTKESVGSEGGLLWDFKFPSDCSGLLFGKDGQTIKSLQQKFGVTIHAAVRGKYCMVSIKGSNLQPILNACLEIWGRLSISHPQRQEVNGVHCMKLADWSKVKLIDFMCGTMTYVNISKGDSETTAHISGWTKKSVIDARDTVVYNRVLHQAPFGLWNLSIPSNRGGLIVGKEGKTLEAIEDKFNLKVDMRARGAVCEIRVFDAKNREDVLNAYLDIYWRMSYSMEHKQILPVELSRLVRNWNAIDRLKFMGANQCYSKDEDSVIMYAWSPTWLEIARKKIEFNIQSSSTKSQSLAVTKQGKNQIMKQADSTSNNITSKTQKTVTPSNNMSASSDELNILLLGESGIGKSTFINGFYNHVKYTTFDDAKKEGVHVCIRASFSHVDSLSKHQKISVEAADDPTDKKNEVLENGKSATQEPRSYVFELRNGSTIKTVRLIDTPGLLDTNGLEQDMLNMKKTFSYISNFKKLNAICILMRPDEDRLNHYVRYCICELLTRLHCDASRNLLFCFTRSSGTNFRPAGTLDTLKKLLAEIEEEKGVRINLNSETMFCFDNVAFRMLCALKSGISLSNDRLKAASESWEQSAAQTKRLLLTIEKLPQHDVQKTLVINKARSSVLSLSRPLADTTKNQILNQENIKEKMAELEKLLSEGKVLRERLVCEQQCIRAVPMKKPQLVCADPMCVDYVTVGQHTELHYKKVCHDNCLCISKDSTEDHVQKCIVFSRHGIEKCEQCGHSWKYHTHVRYKLEKTTKTIDTTSLKKDITNNESLVTTAKDFITALKKKHVEMNAELNFLSHSSAQFAAFINANSMMNYNDAYKQFIDKAIEEETCKLSCKIGSEVLLDRLKDFKASYDLQVKKLRDTRDSSAKALDLTEIEKLIKKLKGRPLSGAFLSKAQNIQREPGSEKKLTERKFTVVMNEASNNDGGSTRKRMDITGVHASSIPTKTTEHRQKENCSVM